MREKTLTEKFPFLLPIRKKQRKLFFYLAMHFDGNKYSKEKINENLKYKVYGSESLMVNEDSGFDIKYQLNKMHNLKLASKTINKLVIKPNEVFSFWQLVKDADKEEAYKEGLNLVNGEIVGSYGGGLCQLSNMLFWLFLHTPLTIIERHSHRVQNFAPGNSALPVGIDATISEGWKDLKVKNESQSSFQIVIDFDDEYMYGSIYSDLKPMKDYKIFNWGLQYFKENQSLIEETSVCRRETDREREKSKDLFLYKNKTIINYKLNKNIKISEREAV